jgi:uncharacterized membrane protein YcaP (DUF421 family)
MIYEITQALDQALGLSLEPRQLGYGQITLRAVVIFTIGLVLVRLGVARLFGKYAAFDTLLSITLGSVLGRAINGSAPFFQTIVASAVLIGLHWLLSVVTLHFHRLSSLLKGNEYVIVRDGQVQESELRKHKIGRHDLLEDLRLQGKVQRPEDVEVAYLERSGQISAIPKKGQPQVLEVKVENGVQTVRIQLG